MKKFNVAFDTRDTAGAVQKEQYLPTTSLFKEIREAVYRYPSVCMVLPFNPKMGGKVRLAQQLQVAVAKVASELADLYPEDVCDLLMRKLQSIATNINLNTYKQSLVIYLSPVFEKVYYLNMPVEERIWVDTSFEMRGLLQAKKQQEHYLLLSLGNNNSQVFLGSAASLERLLHFTPQTSPFIQPGGPGMNAHIANGAVHRSGSTVNFLQHTDQLLHEILVAWPLPVIVLADDGLLCAFKDTTQHATNIVQYAPVEHELNDTDDLLKKVHSMLRSGADIAERHLQNQLQQAASKNLLYTGTNDVWAAVKKGRGRLLILPEQQERLSPELPHAAASIGIANQYNQFSCVKNDLDAMIEILLLNDGDVKLVRGAWLEAYGNMALI